MPKLNDTHTILLSTASRRDDFSLYPLPATITAGASTTKAINTLIKASFAERRDDSTFATIAGLAAIGVTVGEEEGDDDQTDAPEPPATTPSRPTKASVVIDLLKHDDGATLAELIAATGWLPHTTRAALTGLRKKGHDIERYKRDDVTTYRIAG